MKATPTRKLQVYVAAAAVGSIAGLALGLPQLVALTAPFAVYAAIGLALTRKPQLSIAATVARRRAMEDEPVAATVTLTASSAVEGLQLELATGAGVDVAGAPLSWPRRLAAGGLCEVDFELRASRWGAYDLGALRARATDRFGLIRYELSGATFGRLRALPSRETLRLLLAPLELQATTGSRVARDRGEGIEFAENRPFLPGDRLRRINWRLTARRGTPYVSERHPERNADVILFLDTFAEVGGAGGRGTLASAVRAATSLAAAYLARKDRVGAVGFGGMLIGVRPRLGLEQLYQIIDSLLGSEVIFSYAQKDVSFVPRRMLPPKALVIGISPLLDDRYINALLDLRARGFDLAVVEVSPEPFAAPSARRSGEMAYRLWLLQREALRTRLQELGAPVGRWRDDEPLQIPLATTAEVKRRLRRPLAA
ncbi:MAG: DUF58 domain-containing protein [Solirubrobacteraceae bacterium]